MDKQYVLDFINEKSERIDKVLVTQGAERSRSYWQKMIREGYVRIDGVVVDKVNTLVTQGAHIQVLQRPSTPLNVVAEAIPLDIVYQDADVVVINKPRGMVVHPGFGHLSGTLVNALLYHIKDLSSINGVIRPGIVHRIDKDTSGLLLVAKNDAAHVFLAKQLKDKTLYREYVALVHGNIPQEKLTIDLPIGRDHENRKQMAIVETGKPAVTHVEVRERYGDYTLVHCRLETGRTHQIRVHLQSIGYPLVGDPLYSKKTNPFGLSGQFLHAYQLGFIHPRTKKSLVFTAQLPDVLLQIIEKLRKM